jgi:hypothetical protein
MTNAEQSVESELAGETEVLGKNQPQCLCPPQIPPMAWPEKILGPTGTRTPTSSVVQPVASRYTDRAIPAPDSKHSVLKSPSALCTRLRHALRMQPYGTEVCKYI